MANNWTINAYIGSSNASENHLDYINEGKVMVTEAYILSGFKNTIDLKLTISDTDNQTAWKACDNVEIVLMSAPASYPRLSKYQEKRVVSEPITTRNTTTGGGSCTLSDENAYVLVAGNNLYVGAVGYDSTGTIVRTTNMQYACPIEQGASVEELTDGAQMSLTAMEALLQRVNTAVESVEEKLDASGYDGETDFGYMPVVNASGNLRVRPLRLSVTDGNLVLRGTTSQIIASIPLSDLGISGGDDSASVEEVSNDYWTGYKYPDGRMTLKSAKKSSFLYAWTVNSVTGTRVSSPTIAEKEVFPVGFVEPPTISLMHTAGTTDYTGIYLYTDYARCTADTDDNTYKMPPAPKFCYTPSSDATGGMNDGTFYLIAEGRWK